MRVLVVGAGLAGLTAASRLQGHGADVTVFEARHRVGGRVWSHRFENGAVVELGGEWIDSSHAVVTGLAEELGLRLVDTKQDFITRDLIGSDPIDAGDHARLLERLLESIEKTARAELEWMSVADFLDRISHSGPAMTVLRSRLEGTFGISLSRVAATELGEEFGLAQDSTYLRVEGGNDRLATGLAADLDLRLNSPVRRIGQGWVSTDDGDLDADQIVVAVPLPILKRPGFLVDSPPSLRGPIDTIHMGTAAKAAVATVAEPPMFRRQEPDIPGWYWTGADADGSTRRAVTGFAGTARGTRALTAESRERIATAVPETELLGTPLVVDWGLDPWAGGCYSALGPGQHGLLEFFRAPVGRVVFAGEHVNGSGTIDGAIRSGIDAARLTMESM